MLRRLLIGLILVFIYVILSEEKNILKGMIIFIIGVAATSFLTSVFTPTEDKLPSVGVPDSGSDQTQEEDSSGEEAGEESGEQAEGQAGEPSASRTILHVRNTEDGVRVNAQPGTGNSVLVELHGSDISIVFLDEVQQGYGSDNVLHDWYRIEVSDIYGWVRTDMVEQKETGYFEKIVEGEMNMRSDHTYNSPIEATICDGTRLEYQGQREQGTGKDGAMHEWMYVKTVGPFTGWVRGDLTK